MKTEKRKIKVLHVLNSNSYSGAENVAITIINGIKEEFEVAYASPDGSIRNCLKENNIKYFPIYERTLTVKELKRIVYTYKPDIIHAHDFTASTIASLFSKNISIVNHLHNNWPWLKKYSFKTLAYLVAASRAKQILTVSDSIMQEYVFGNYLAHKTNMIGNPIDVNIIKQKSVQAELTDFSDIIFLGRLTEQKNPIGFLDIVYELHKKINNLKVAVVGSGVLEKQMLEKCHLLGLDNCVKFYGFVKNPYGLLKSSKILCMPSLWEGFGLSSIEALSLGKPVVASNVGGIPLIIDNSCGYLCNTRNEFIDALFNVLTNTALYDKKVSCAKDRAMLMHNIEEYMKNIKSVYCSIYNN